jgi:uncharacterized protein (DUF2252 family)
MALGHRENRDWVERPLVGTTSVEPAELYARGKRLRDSAPVTAHDHAAAAPDRPGAQEYFAVSNAGRLPELAELRRERMAASPFTFFRGAAGLMAADLAGTPSSGLAAQLCGDAHAANFGLYGTPEGRIVMDINDFDETVPGPWEWDLKRLAASAEVAARGNGFGRKTRRAIVLAVVARYRREMRALVGRGELDAWQLPADVDDLRERYQAILDRRERRLAAADLARARDRAGVQALDKLTREAGGRLRFAADPPLLVPVADLAGTQETAGLEIHLNGIIADYRRTLEWDRRFLIGKYRVADMARKVVGVGSVGMRCFIVLLTGRDPADRLYLQVKEAVPSVLSEFVGASPYPSQGERVVAGQRLMQAASDVFLGWHRTRSGPARDYYVRQLRDWKFSLMVEDMDPAAMHVYAQLCGQTLARAHARSGDRIAVGAYLPVP